MDYEDKIWVQLIGGPYCGEWKQVMRGMEWLHMPEPLEPVWDIDKQLDPMKAVKTLVYREMPVWYKDIKANFMVYNKLSTDEALGIVSKYTGWPYDS
jgi:hypothetical protein